MEFNPGAGIQRNQIHFGPHAANQFDEFAGALWRIIHPIEKDIFEGQFFPVSQGEVPRRSNQLFQIPFAIDRHQAAAHFVIRGVQRNRQLGPHGFGAEIVDARHNSGR